MVFTELTDREKSVLRYVIHQFILTANPVGSRNISKRYNIGYSPATIRNIMADLEDYGFLNHPHISAGRIPTDDGYRFYVDSLMDPPKLKKSEKKQIDLKIERTITETDDLLRLTSMLLSGLTNQLACVTYPKFDNAILEKIQLVSLFSKRILVVLSLKSGLVKTITLEVSTNITLQNLPVVQSILNQRLSGLRFSEIKKTFKERIEDVYNSKYKPIIRLFLESVEKIFEDIKVSEKSIITGTKNILSQPEFENHEELQGIIELIEDKDVIVHILQENNNNNKENLKIVIGKENNNSKLENFSMIKKEYKLGDASGVLGIVGPKRMHYAKSIAVIVYLAETLSHALKNKKS